MVCIIWKLAELTVSLHPSIQLDVIGVTYDLIRKYLPDKPVYSAIGNHDTNPVNRYDSTCVTCMLCAV